MKTIVMILFYCFPVMLLCYFFSSGWFNGIRFSFTVGVFITFVALTLDYVFFLISRFQNVLWFNAIITICVNVASMYSSVTTKRLVRMFALISVDLLGIDLGIHKLFTVHSRFFKKKEENAAVAAVFKNVSLNKNALQ